ncbi:MAG TPA: chemotaxis protein CheW [Thermoanaerobaculia bacterium]|nr:chemotaxis protein CheW [Thermoanaerobaculia bacterium]
MGDEALVVIVAGARRALPMARVLEVRVYDGATRVPGAPEWVRGIVEREGVPVRLIDAARLDAQQSLSSGRACVVFFEDVAVLVDDVDGLVPIDSLEDGCALLDLESLLAGRNDS